MKNNYTDLKTVRGERKRWRRCVFILSLFFILPLFSAGQSYSSSKPPKIEQIEKDNDYYIKYKMSLPHGFSKCPGVHWENNRPIRLIGSNWQEFDNTNGGWGSRTITVATYPGAGIKLGAKYWSGSHLFNCHRWSTRVIWMRAANLKQPYNFAHLYEEENKQIVLRWSNATNVPNGKYRVQVRRTNLATNRVENFQVNGGTTNYTDRLRIIPGARFKYEIRTHHPGGYSNAGLSNSPQRNSPWVSREVTLPGIINDFEVDTRRKSIKFSWSIRNTYFHNNIRLEYKEGTSWNLIEELTATTDQYTWTPSFALVPGDTYSFRVRAMDNMTQIQKLEGMGGLAANGVLSGHVKIANSEKGVPFVPIKIESKENRYVGYKYYQFAVSTYPTADHLDNMTPVKSGVTSTFNIGARNRNEYYGFIFDSWIYLPTDGNYTFYSNSDDGSRLYINDQLWINNDGHHPMQERSHSGNLDAGYHKIRVKFVQGGGGHGLQVKYAGPGISKREIPADVLHKSRAVERTVETDEEGYFYVDELYYGEEAEFDIIPMKDDSDIRPDTIRRTLSISDYKQDDVRFEDYSSIPVYGKLVNGDCAIPEAFVVFNGKKTKTKTKADGSFEYIIQSPDPTLSNTLDIEYKSHTIEGRIDLDLTTDTRNKSNPHIFRDVQKDTLILSVFSGCDKPIADEVDVELFSANKSGNICKSFTFSLDNAGVDTLYLPAMEYRARVADLRINNSSATEQDRIDFNAVKNNIISELGELKVDLTQRDTVKVERVEITDKEKGKYTKHVEVVAVNLVKAPFVFRQSIDVDIEGNVWNNASCTHTVEVDGEEKDENVYLMTQNDEYPVKFKLQEIYNHYRLMTHQCGVDSASILINDNISDRDQIKKTIIDGTLNYTIVAGEANLEGPWNTERAFQKNIGITAEVPNYKKELFDQKWALVTGHKILEPAFFTSELHLPEFILHDPPGDRSYAFLEKGSSISSKISINHMLRAGLDAVWDNTIEIPNPAGTLGIGWYSQLRVGSGYGSNKSDTYTTTFKERVKTSNNAIEPGEGSDMIIGSGLNFIYSKSKELTFDCLNGPKINSSFALSPGYHTRYMLSVRHVRSHVVPTLDSILTNISKLETKASGGVTLNDDEAFLIATKDIFVKSKTNWKKILTENRRRIFTGGNQLSEKEKSIANITFSGASAFDYESSNDTLTSESKIIPWNVEAKLGAFIGYKSQGAKFNGVVVKVGAYVNYDGNKTDTNTSSNKLTQGFHLEDESNGDFFNLNVTKDPVFGTYLFQTVSGRSNCPNEPFTQSIDRIKMSVVSNPELRNLPKGKTALFKIRIDNDSQSEESRSWAFNTLTGQNDGTEMSIGAHRIQRVGKIYPFFIPPNGTNEYILKVKPGPKTRSLPIELVGTPECVTSIYKTEDLLQYINKELDKTPRDIDKISLFVSWESDCDAIQIDAPHDGFVFNSVHQSELPMIISGFDPNSREISNIEIEYRKVSSFEWEQLMFIDKSAIGEYPVKHLNIDLSELKAGKYFFRAKVYCGDLNVANYSNIVSGRVDHNPFVALYSNIENGWLRNEQLHVTFSKPLGQSRVKLTLFETDGEEVAETVYLNAKIEGNKAILDIPNPHLFEGRKFKAVFETGETINADGELLGVEQSFDFILELVGAKWEQSNKLVYVVKGQTKDFSANLVNELPNDVDFKIVSNTLSAYITPEYNSGAIPGNGVSPVLFTINEDTDLPIGNLKGEITAELNINGTLYRKKMHVELKVRASRPGWEKPTDKSYQMHIVAQFTPSSTANIPLSTDERDMISAFIDGKIAGVSKIYWDENVKKYIAFINVLSDSPNGTIKFKMWDASANLVCWAKEELSFANNTVKGSHSTPFILHASGAMQTILLNPGWNFVSFHVSAESNNISKVFNDLTQNGTQVKHISDGFSEFSASSNSWNGALENIDFAKAYKVYVPEEDVLTIEGSLLKPVYPIGLGQFSKRQMNWVANHTNELTSLEDAINKEELEGGEVIRNDESFSILSDDKSSWYGSLKAVNPGKGYMLFHPEDITGSGESNKASLRIIVNAELEQTAAEGFCVNLSLGGDTLGLYRTGNKGGIPNSLFDSQVEFNAGERSVEKVIDFSEGDISADDFLKNHLVFMVKKSSATNNGELPKVSYSKLLLQVLNDEGEVQYQYNYGDFMKELSLGHFEDSDEQVQLSKVYVRAKDHRELVQVNSKYLMAPTNFETNIAIKEKSAGTSEQLVRKNGPFTMTMISKVVLNGIEVNNKDFVLEVLNNEEVIAQSYSKTGDWLMNKLQYLLIKCNDGEELSQLNFRLTNIKSGEKYDSPQMLNFDENKLIGSTNAPYAIRFGDDSVHSEKLILWPNPVCMGQPVEVMHKDYDENSSIRIVVRNLQGVLIAEMEKSSYSDKLNTSGWKPGVYITTAYESNKIIGKEKLVVK
ncbi:hypothetical protein EMN47_17810 [Prolixibacteraceae bacterium JC049]|nr:hypothetical protein [Prolixibacteraceae bacterium JC049]